MNKYEKAEMCWKSLVKIMKEIDSDVYVKTGQHLSLDEARDLAVAFILFGESDDLVNSDKQK